MRVRNRICDYALRVVVERSRMDVGGSVVSVISGEASEAPSGRPILGRERDVAAIGRLIRDGDCRLCLICGLGGVGKSTLAHEVARARSAEGIGTIWCSLKNPPRFQELLGYILARFPSGGTASLSPLDDVLRALQEYPSLVVLDNFETLFTPEQTAGKLRPEYTDYRELLEAVVEREHRSFVLITSRERRR
jgi:hypothetical protein